MKVVTNDRSNVIETDTPQRNLCLPVLTWELYDLLMQLQAERAAAEPESGN